MKRRYKFIKRLGIALIVLWGLSRLWLGYWVSPSVVEKKLEENFNCEAKVESCGLNFFANSLSIKNLELQEVGRTGTAPISLSGVKCSMSPWHLVVGKFKIAEFLLSEPRVDIVLYKDGGNSLKEMFRKKKDNKDKQAKKKEEPKESSKKKKEQRNKVEVKDEKKTGVLNVYEFSFFAVLENISITNGNFNVTIEKDNLGVVIKDFNSTIDKFEINLMDLEESNEANLRMDANIELISSANNKQRYGLLGLSGNSKIRLFDPATGDMNLRVEGKSKISKDSYLDPRMPIVIKGWKVISQLKSLGLGVDATPPMIKFKGEEFYAIYEDEGILFKKPIGINWGPLSSSIMEESYLHTQNGEHSIGVEILLEGKAGGVAANLLRGGASKLSGSVGRFIQEGTSEFTPYGEKISVKLRSTGDMSDPKIRLDGGVLGLGKIEDSVKITKNLINELVPKDKRSEVEDNLKDEAKKLFKDIFK